MTKQLPALTSLRGIAALFILLHHITLYLLPEQGKFVGGFTPFLQKSYLWVDFFFILSGFIMTHVYRETFNVPFTWQTFRRYMISRFARIYPLHFIMLVCFVVLEFTTLYLYSQTETPLPFEELPFGVKHSIKSLITNILMLQTLHSYSSWNEPAWAISAEWILYFFIPLIIFYAARSHYFCDCALIFLAYLCLFFMSWHIGNLDFLTWKSLLRCTSDVIIGVLSYKFFLQTRVSRPWGNSLLTWALLLATLTTICLPINHALTILIFPLLVISAASIKPHSFLASSPLLLLGRISYSIYIVHWFVLQLVAKTVLWLTGKALRNQLTLAQMPFMTALIVLSVIFISFIVYKYLEEPLRFRIKSFSTKMGLSPSSTREGITKNT
jgi:peptidoglycan/LPS O-acetylase OafA/YrhL